MLKDNRQLQLETDAASEARLMALNSLLSGGFLPQVRLSGWLGDPLPISLYPARAVGPAIFSGHMPKIEVLR